jgi:hypothetical protein
MEVEQPENLHHWDWDAELQQEAQPELLVEQVDPKVVVLDDDDSEYQLSDVDISSGETDLSGDDALEDDEDPNDEDIKDADPKEEDPEELIDIDGMGT